jgi:hypothetical protein
MTAQKHSSKSTNQPTARDPHFQSVQRASVPTHNRDRERADGRPVTGEVLRVDPSDCQLITRSPTVLA